MRRSGVVLLVCVAACARTGLLDFEGDDSDAEAGAGGSGGTNPVGGTGGRGGTGGVPDECRTTSDCPITEPCAPPTCRSDGSGPGATMRCVPAPIVCNDEDPCTTDSCDSATGTCQFDFPSDQDGDGFFGKPPPDAPPSCGGDDCDDEDSSVNPLGIEVCDGRDNDCDRAIDEGSFYENVLVQPRPIVPDGRDRATHGGLVWNGQAYAMSYNTTSGHKQSYFKLLTPFGEDASAEVEVSPINADAYSGFIEWSGTSFFTAFSDARQGGNYEVYFARFRSDGVKVQGDVRVTDARDFSLNPVVVWTGEEFVVAWDDRRGRQDGGMPQIFARRFSEFGTPVGGEVLISPPDDWGEFPALAVGDRRLGLAYVSLGADAIPRGRFRTLDFSLGSMSEPVHLPGSEYTNYPSIAYADGHFAMAWGFNDAASIPGNAVRVAYASEGGGAPFPGQSVTGFSYVRGPSLVSLGDRVFVVFSGAQADGAYELHAATLAPTSTGIVVSTRLTFTPALSLFPYAARGPDGTIGVVFDEDDEMPPNSRKPYFLSVGCAPILK